MEQTFGEKVIQFNRQLNYTGILPDGFQVMNPFFDNPETMLVMEQFYSKFYNDHRRRKFIIGINPSRNGAGVTGVPFTDTKRLASECGIRMHSAHTHEISSVFLYDMILQYGGTKMFYRDFYINSPFPLAITRVNKDRKLVNANYYDDERLFRSVKSFMVASMLRHFSLGADRARVYILGKKNAAFLSKLNQEYQLYEEAVVLDHPRYIQQYKSKEKQLYIDAYLEALTG